MRTKTLLLFVFLLTGMAFSQQGGTGQITFKKITTALSSPEEKIMKIRFLEWGYKNIIGNVFQKGSENFEIWIATDGTRYYKERFASKERYDEIRTQAIEAGLKETQSYDDIGHVVMEGNGFSVVIRQFTNIMIRTLKK